LVASLRYLLFFYNYLSCKSTLFPAGETSQKCATLRF
jgi:hypothetical protein